MLPAPTLAAISNVVALNLEAQTTMAVLGAILSPLLRSSQTEDLLEKKPARTTRPKRKKPRRRRVKANAEATDGPRQRAARALAANPNATLTRIAKIAKCSRGTVVNARDELAAEGRKVARDELAADARKPRPSERRERAQRFLRDRLAHGPKQVSAVEEAAAKAHVDPHALEQARAELGIVPTPANTGGAQAVQWSLPAP